MYFVTVDFTKTSQRVGVYSMDATYVDVLSDYQCADMCRNMTGFTCLSFDYCPLKKQCQLSRRHTPDGQLLKINAYCDHYSSKLLTVLEFSTKLNPLLSLCLYNFMEWKRDTGY